MKADPNDSLARSSIISSRITDGPALDWAALVPLTLHPVKVSIVEAMEWIGEPVSATELTEMFEEPESHYLSLVSYHIGKLVDLGAVEKISHRAVRGARETFYFLEPAMTVLPSR